MKANDLPAFVKLVREQAVLVIGVETGFSAYFFKIVLKLGL
jgi:hypothetical protein